MGAGTRPFGGWRGLRKGLLESFNTTSLEGVPLRYVVEYALLVGKALPDRRSIQNMALSVVAAYNGGVQLEYLLTQIPLADVAEMFMGLARADE